MNTACAINGSTRLYGLIGSHIQHTLSPAIHNGAFSHYGMNCVYIPLQTEITRNGAQSAKKILEVAKIIGFNGLNVTMPYKESLISCVDQVDEDVQATGALNTILIKENVLYGYNTDVYGFQASLHHAHVTVENAKCLVLGTGGAAKAVAFALSKAGAASIAFAGRSVEKAYAVATALQASTRKEVVIQHLLLSALDTPGTAKYDIVVNATPVGMEGHDQMYADYRLQMHRGQVFFDLVYHPAQTVLMALAEKTGATVVGGLDMLIFQAIQSFKIWTGITPSYALIRKAVTEKRG